MTKTVLFVDDSATMQLVADITFRGTDFAFVGVTSADAAMAQAKARKPTVVVVDAQMPGKTGYDLCQLLKADPGTADVPVVVLCGNSTPYDAARGAQVAADANLAKPWDTTQFVDKLNEIITQVAANGPARLQSKQVPTAIGIAPPPAGIPAAQPAPLSPAAMAAAPAPGANPFAPNTLAGGTAMPPRSATMMGMSPVRPPTGLSAAAPAGAPGPAQRPSSGLSAAAAQVAPQPAASSGLSAANVAPRPARPSAPLNAVSPNTVPARQPSAGFSGPAVVQRAPTAPPSGPLPAAATPGRQASNPALAAHPPMAAVAPAATPAPASYGSSAPARAPLVAGSPTKRSALVEQTLAKMAARLAEATGLTPGSPELLALLKLSTEVVERVVWEVVPELAERIIRENLDTLARRPG